MKELSLLKHLRGELLIYGTKNFSKIFDTSKFSYEEIRPNNLDEHTDRQETAFTPLIKRTEDR